VARPLWKGAISFGLVTIPVHIYSATRRSELRFRHLDRRDTSPIREKRVNQETGKEVGWDDVVKGFEYEEGSFVVLEPDDFTRANVKATQTIDIVQAVPRDVVAPQFFDTPLYVVPTKAGVKAYHILRETLRRTGRMAVATIVMRGRQHLAGLLADEQVLTLELLRFAHEIKTVADLELEDELEPPNIRAEELELAEQLVAMLDGPWQPEEFHDQYRDDLLALIKKKAAEGGLAPVRDAGSATRAPAEVVDMMELLKKSVGEAHERKTRRRKAS
jgi:DNA end-binding protein Ku